jgi:hypothetical protein
MGLMDWERAAKLILLALVLWCIALVVGVLGVGVRPAH